MLIRVAVLLLSGAALIPAVAQEAGGAGAVSEEGASGRGGLRVVELVVKSENIDRSFWKSEKDTTCFLNFFVYLEGPAATAEDIEFCEIIDPNGISWSIDPSKFFSERSQYVGGYGRWWNSTYSWNGSVVALGPYMVVLKTSGGSLDRCPFVLNAPGSLDSSRYGLLYTEDYEGKVGPEYVRHLARAEIAAAQKMDRGIEIEFSVDDPRVFNGDIALYDIHKNYVGTSGDFFNPYSEVSAAFINGGEGLETQGGINRATLSPDDISFKSGYGLSNIAAFVVNLRDGGQYRGGRKKDQYLFSSKSYMHPLEGGVDSEEHQSLRIDMASAGR